MGNCECLRKPEKEEEINITFKDKYNHNDDYSKSMKNNKAKQLNNNFSVVEQNDEEEEDKPQHNHKYQESDYREVEVEDDDNARYTNFSATFRNDNIQKEVEIKPKKEEKIEVAVKKEEVINKVNEEPVIEVEEKRKNYNEDNIKYEMKAPAVVDDNKSLSGDSDIDDTIFNSANFSKAVFNLINNTRLHPHSIIDGIKRFIIPKNSRANESNREDVINFLESIPSTYKGKTFLWNEKVYGALRPIYQKKANGENIDDKIADLFEDTKFSQLIEKYFETSGKFDVNQTFYSLLLENSNHIKRILFESTPICSVCSVQSSNKTKTLTCLVLIKKK